MKKLVFCIALFFVVGGICAAETFVNDKISFTAKSNGGVDVKVLVSRMLFPECEEFRLINCSECKHGLIPKTNIKIFEISYGGQNIPIPISAMSEIDDPNSLTFKNEESGERYQIIIHGSGQSMGYEMIFYFCKDEIIKRELYNISDEACEVIIYSKNKFEGK